MVAINGAVPSAITMNEIKQPDIQPKKTAEGTAKTPVEPGSQPIRNEAVKGDGTGIEMPKVPAGGSDLPLMDKITSSLADLQSLLSSVKDAKEQIEGKLNELNDFASVDTLKSAAKELNLSANWQLAFSVISGALSLGMLVMNSVNTYKDHCAAQQESALQSGIDKTQADIGKITDGLKDPKLPAAERKEMETQLAALQAELATQQSALSELKAGLETRHEWTELALNLMQGASGFINDNLLQPHDSKAEAKEGGTLAKLEDLLGQAETAMGKVKDGMKSPQDFLNMLPKA